MKKLKMDSSTLNFIRAALRVRLYDALETLSEIINDPDARAADKIKAINVLGQYGLDSADQAAVHLHAGDGAQVIGVVRLPELDLAWGPNGEPIDGQGKRVEVGQDGMGLLSEDGLEIAS